jgi:opacity protein-like surface antigen
VFAILVVCLCTSKSAFPQTAPPKMKMTTAIPPQITTPDSVETAALAMTAAQAQAPDSSPAGTGSPSASAADPGQAPSPSKAAPASSSAWNIDATFYFWLPGIHGNLNAFGYNLGYKASPGDLLSHAKLGLMGLVGIEHKRFVVIGDLIWTPLEAEKTKVFQHPQIADVTAKVKYTPLTFTTELGYRLVNHERLKIDGLTGFRYWHQENTLTVTPPPPSGNDFYVARNWTDPLVGARIQFPLSPKVLATIWGDVGGWGAGSQLDYQIVGALSYKFKPKWAMDVAWRYLFLEYDKNQFTSQLAESGIVLGVTYIISK